jgi:hypothetical protein
MEMRESTARGNIAVPMALRRSRGGLDRSPATILWPHESAMKRPFA